MDSLHPYTFMVYNPPIGAHERRIVLAQNELDARQTLTEEGLQILSVRLPFADVMCQMDPITVTSDRWLSTRLLRERHEAYLARLAKKNA